MIKSPEVSIIIPAYNRAHTITRAINSVLNQTFQDFEILVVDDGSTDNTSEIIQKLTDKRIRYIQQNTNKGAAAARNTGIKLAQGNYIALLDSDDEWLPQKLEQQLSQLKSSNSKIQGSCTAFIVVDGNTEYTYHPMDAEPWLKTMLYGCDQSPGATLLVSKSALDKIGLLDESLPRYEDWDWLIRFVKLYDLLLIQVPLAKVYYHAKPSGDKMEQSAIRLLEKHKTELGKFGWLYKRKILSIRWLEVAWHYHAGERNLQKERVYFFKTIVNYPLQHPGVYIAAFDSIFGSNLRSTLSRIKRKIFNQDPITKNN